MSNLCLQIWNDETGFVISSELVLISTIAVLAMVVGLSEVSGAINQELEDVASAFGTVNQSYRYQGLTGHGGTMGGTGFHDLVDLCDGAADISRTAASSESHGSHGHDHWN